MTNKAIRRSVTKQVATKRLLHRYNYRKGYYKRGKMHYLENEILRSSFMACSSKTASASIQLPMGDASIAFRLLQESGV